MANDLMNNQNKGLDDGRDSFFGQMARHFFQDDFPFSSSMMDHRMMKTDVSETDDAYKVTIDLPGLKKEDIELDYQDGTLTVSGKQNREDEAKDDKGNVIHSERYYGSYYRQYALPNVKRDGISAKYEQGVLMVELPKAGDKPEQGKIKIQ